MSAAGPPVAVPRRIVIVGATTLLVLTIVIASGVTRWFPLQAAWFDFYQSISPRTIISTPALVVEIDEATLAAFGQWPWPRTQLAELVDAIAVQRPAAIGVDILMPEVDPLSPERLIERARKSSPALAGHLESQPTNDSTLARSLANAPSVLAIAGTHEAKQRALRTAPFSVLDKSATGASAPVFPAIARFDDVLTSRDEIDGAAVGHGLISVEPAGGVIRTIPLAADVHGTLVPAFSIEMLRVAKHVPQLRLLSSGLSAQGISIGDFTVATEADGSVRPYYSLRSPLRIVSAQDVMTGRVAPDRFESKLVLIGVTGLGLLEYQNTPLGIRMPGVEIHAQLLENLFDNTLLRRPTWAPALEAAAFLLLGALLIYATPRWNPRNAALLVMASIALLLGSGYVLFRAERILFDGAIPSASLLLLFGVLLVLTLTEATRQRRVLEQTVQRQREQSARMSGELEAAQQVQTATLPRAELLSDEPRVDLAAVMSPAREVGGDLYDFFRLDDRRLFVLVGDVAGKGLSASIFMAVSKALYKSAMLRDPGADIGSIMSAANAEISRDNPQMLFVTVFAAVLDLESGDLDYCNAGHEYPLLLEPGAQLVQRLDGGGGPPLCTVEGFAYRGARLRLTDSALLCVVTDGVVEARNPQGVMYGKDRLEGALLRAARTHPSAKASALLAALRADLAGFVADAEQDDDATLLLLRWTGPPSTPGAKGTA